MDKPGHELRDSLLLALFATALAFCWQFAIVHFDHGGNWTSLFYTGQKSPMPEELAQERIYLFPDVVGYDGQMYHLVAHDPLFRRNFVRDIDFPPMRYRRILVPGLAALLSFGQERWIDPAYFSVILGSVFLGTFWLARWSVLHGGSVYWGLVFLATPAALLSIPMMVIDVSLAALTAGFLFYAEVKSPARLFAVLACAALARETGILILIGWCAWLLFQRQFALAIKYAAAALPAACWALFVQMHTQQVTLDRLSPTPLYGVQIGPIWLSPIPLSGIFHAFLHPFVYPAGLMENLLVPMDRLALAGMVAALVFVVHDAVRPAVRDYKTFVALAFTALALFLAGEEVWPEVNAFGRSFTPLLLIVTISGALSKTWLRFIPLLLIDPRIGLIYITQAGRILRGILAQ